MIEKVPKYVVLSVMTTWLSVESLCMLDSSICNVLERKQFLNIFECQPIKILYAPQAPVNSQFMKWISCRGLFVCKLIVKSCEMNEFDQFGFFLSKLTSLVLDDSLHSIKMESLLYNCGGTLLHLSIGVSSLEDNAAVAIGKHCRKLITLKFTCDLPSKTYQGNTSVTDKTLEYISMQCPFLEVVLISRLKGISDVSVYTFCQHCPNITSFGLSYAEDDKQCISLAGIYAHCPNLTELTLRGLSRDVDGLQRILDHCQQLTALNFSQCNQYHVEMLATIIFKSGNKNIRVLDLSEGFICHYCCDWREKVTTNMRKLLDCCPQLTSLNMAKTVLKHREDATALVEALLTVSSLREVNFDFVFVPPSAAFEQLKTKVVVSNQLKLWQSELYQSLLSKMKW